MGGAHPLILQQPNFGLGKFLCLLKLPPTLLEKKKKKKIATYKSGIL